MLKRAELIHGHPSFAAKTKTPLSGCALKCLPNISHCGVFISVKTILDKLLSSLEMVVKSSPHLIVAPCDLEALHPQIPQFAEDLNQFELRPSSDERSRENGQESCGRSNIGNLPGTFQVVILKAST